MSRSTYSDSRAITPDEADATGVEPWLKISLAAFVPLVLAFYLPDEWRTALFVAGGLLVLGVLIRPYGGALWTHRRSRRRR